jgi:ubiquitin C-terminal hydrolase
MGAGCTGKGRTKAGSKASEPGLDMSYMQADFMTSVPNRMGKKDADKCRYGNSAFENLGNSCYLNVVLQVLVHTQPFADYIASRTFEVDGCQPDELDFDSTEVIRGIADVMRTVWAEVYDIVVPKLMHRVIKQLRPHFANDKQQDAHEAFELMVEKLHFCFNAFTNKKLPETAWVDANSAESLWLSHLERNCSIIVDLFHGLMKSTLRCLRCGHISTKYEVFSTIPLPISESSRSLRNCLDEYLSAETLTKAWDCPSCNTLVDCIKKLDLVRVPPILAIVFKRYSYPTTKLAHRMTCPVTDFNIDDLVPDSTQATYDMYAKIVHTGSADSGHYYVLTKHHKVQKWRKANDAEMEEVDLTVLEGYNEETYMVFYYNKTMPTYKRQMLTRTKAPGRVETNSTRSESLVDLRRSVFEEKKKEKPLTTVPPTPEHLLTEDDIEAEDLDPPSNQFVGLTRHPNRRSNGDLRGLEQKILLSN